MKVPFFAMRPPDSEIPDKLEINRCNEIWVQMIGYIYCITHKKCKLNGFVSIFEFGLSIRNTATVYAEFSTISPFKF